MRTFIRVLFIFIVAMQSFSIPVRGQSAGDKLKSRIVEELKRYYSQPFEVTVRDSGMVTIDGVVRSFWDRHNVHTIVARVHGVRAVSNMVVVATDPVPDDIIRAEIEDQLADTRSIEEPGKIHVEVKNGMVTLSGTVGFQREKDIAESIAGWRPGVRSVASEIEVSPPKEVVPDDQLAATVKDVLNRFFPLEKNVQPAVKLGQITLSGTVTKLSALYEIEHEMQNIRGVREVINNLKIDETK